MIGVCFHREKGWEQNQWSFLFSNFGITDIWEIGIDGTKDSHIYQAAQNIMKISQLPDRPLVVLSPKDGRIIKGLEPLHSFTHPKECIYVFGPSNGVLDHEVIDRKPDHYVYIPLVKHEAFSHAAAYMTLWDRVIKHG